MSKTTWRPSVLQLCLGTILALLLAPQPARAAATKITIAKTQDLDFGTFVVLPSCSGCTITIASNGQRTAGAGIVLLNNNVGKAAQFGVTCNNTPCAFTVSTPAPVTMIAGSVSMTAGFAVTQTSPSTPSTLSVGGTLTIPRSGSTPNSYAKTFTVLTSP